ncbi:MULTISPECIES: hypothetical protein [Enterococcus]|uniref:Gram-positive cocci surface proteins LPxTG domain-containing protein n=1 Tax=Candidatus Enterococcus murrayae TaxID=2815321 RepID=A0ABS3HGU9_9ENTE|nr:hypothetical protein [Enterococcus sp. MJM16]MBO0451833.1 hypothetical protein [Enterococcus sp. MJM16]
MKKQLMRIFACLFLSLFVFLANTSIGYGAQELENNKNGSTGKVGFYLEDTKTSESNTKEETVSKTRPSSDSRSQSNKQFPQTGSLIKWSTVGIGIGIIAFCIMLYLTKLVKHLLFYYKKN